MIREKLVCLGRESNYYRLMNVFSSNPLFATISLLGTILRVEKEIRSLRLVTDEATYGGGKFGIGLRSWEMK